MNLRQEQDKNDMMILKQLYYGNHLNSDEVERADKISYLIRQEVTRRLKEW